MLAINVSILNLMIVQPDDLMHFWRWFAP